VATSPQRAYRAACPNCGAPVEFASAASASAVCGFCRSTLVRDGEALMRIGTSAELFDDHSPLQLGAGGRHQGLNFTLVGLLQYGYSGGTWNEWHALFDNGRSGWLSEDNGAYVMAFEAPLPGDAPAIEGLLAGQRALADGRVWDVASVVQAHLIAAQGELPRPPQLHGDFTVVDLRTGSDEVATLDASDPGVPAWSIGRPVLLSELAMSGLAAEAKEKTLGARGVQCPNCGNALTVTLASTKSISCNQCNAVVDLSAGVGGELKHYQQNNSGEGGLTPQIPLGASGTLALGTSAAEPWQVVGYQERCDIPEQDSGDETAFWREYLLYNRALGFAFLVDAEDGWSWMRPVTGAPQVKGDTAQFKGAGYKKKYDYSAKVTWVQGEFYWRLQRGERAHVTDYDGTGGDSRKRLSRERTGEEVVWSAGAVLDANVVADAFGIAAADRAAMQRDAAPTSSAKKSSLGTIIWVIVVIVIIASSLSECDDKDSCDEARLSFGPNSNEYRQCLAQRGSGSSGRTSGGSWGGGGGGGHK
jgi:ribosomal protein S27E